MGPCSESLIGALLRSDGKFSGERVSAARFTAVVNGAGFILPLIQFQQSAPRQG
jgi:hypothetical protein